MKKLFCLLFALLLPLTALGEGWEVSVLSPFAPAEPQTITVLRSNAMFGGLLLVNPWHTRPADFDESAIQPLHTYARYSGLNSFWDDATCQMHPVAIDALLELLQAAKAQGYDRYVVKKGYTFRTCEEQNALFTAEMERQRSRDPEASDEVLAIRAEKYVNAPGTSEFNSGLSFCLYLYSREGGEIRNYYRTTPFYDTPDGQWLLENAWYYGFVFRFPVEGYPTADTADKSDKTGVSPQLNCYRYVGKGHAAAMHSLGLCLEEYIAYLMENPHIAIYENGEMRYEIVWQPVDNAADPFTVLVDGACEAYTLSLDNVSGVATVYEY